MKKLILALGMLLALPLHASTIDYSRWMAALDDNTPITQVSIPGTHDTGTGDGFTDEWKTLGLTFGATQDCSLKQQLATGIRAFDLRPAVVNDNGKPQLHIFHGPMKTNLSFDEAIHTLIQFVNANNTEFAFVVMRHESDSDHESADWSPTMAALLGSAEVRPYIVDYEPNLRVKDVRGKIIVLSRKHYAEKPIGGFVERWTSSDDINAQRGAVVWSEAGKGALYVQDYYDTRGPQMEMKLNNIVRLFDISMNALQRDLSPLAETHMPLVINHMSGYSEEKQIEGTTTNMATNKGYRDNAAHTNKCAIKYLKKHKGPTGLVMMDYAGVNKSEGFRVRGLELTQTVIKQNFK